MELNFNSNLVNKFLAGDTKEFTPADWILLQKILATDEGRNYVFKQMSKDWESGATDNTADFDLLFSNINKEITNNNLDISIKPKHNVRHSVIHYFQRVAAVLLIPIVIAGFWFYSQSRSLRVNIKPVLFTQEYFSPAGMRSKLLLPDSTVVWMNSNSSLKLNETFGKGDRRVKLIGEAFFKVKRNEKCPFIVDAADVNIKVLGTSFNVNAYPDNLKVETVLISGEVLLTTNSKGSNKTETTLIPNQRAVLTKESDQVYVNKVNTERYSSWIDGVLIFDNTSMDEVLSILGKWFNVTFQVDNKEILGYSFTARLDNKSLDQILEFLQFSSAIQFKKEKDDVIILTTK